MACALASPRETFQAATATKNNTANPKLGSGECSWEDALPSLHALAAVCRAAPSPAWSAVLGWKEIWSFHFTQTFVFIMHRQTGRKRFKILFGKGDCNEINSVFLLKIKYLNYNQQVYFSWVRNHESSCKIRSNSRLVSHGIAEEFQIFPLGKELFL